jgi:hypothetical protein
LALPPVEGVVLMVLTVLRLREICLGRRCCFRHGALQMRKQLLLFGIGNQIVAPRRERPASCICATSVSTERLTVAQVV